MNRNIINLKKHPKKICKSWKIISIMGLILLSTLTFHTSVKASNAQPIKINYSHFKRQTFSRKTPQKKITQARTIKVNKFNTTNNKYNPQKYTYITPDKTNHEYYFTNSNLNYMKSNVYGNYIHHVHKINLSQRIFTKIYSKTDIANYHFDLVQFPKKNREWVINTDLNHRKDYHHSDIHLIHFFRRLYKQNLGKYFTNNQIKQILSNQNQFSLLENNDNTTKDESNLQNLRQEEIHWLNFDRQNLYHENPVQENSKYDVVAQRDAKKDEDPEDMDWGSYAPHDSVFDYLTDANDVDNDGTTGHRYSILRPNSTNVGIGQYGDRNTVFLDWGLNNKTFTPIQVNYPTANIFPTEYAKDGEYWSYQFINRTPIRRAKIYIRDKTSNNKSIKITNEHLINNILYYKVDSKALRSHHLYGITIHVPHHHKDTYNVRLYNLIENY